MYWLFSRFFQCMSAQIITLCIFWRKKEKKKSNAEILERKRQLLEENLDIYDDDDDPDNSKSRISNADNSMRDSSIRYTGNF